MKFHTRAAVALCFLALVFSAAAQTSPANSGASSVSAQVPRLIRFSGVAKDETGKAVPGVLGITFALYRDEQGGAPLWIETQNVQADAAGQYTALLGTSKPEGVPLELFTSGEARWLEIHGQGQLEQPRVLLVSVPYAIKAHEAETLSGRSISDFVLNQTTTSSTHTDHVQTSSNALRASTPPPPAGPTSFTGSNSSNIVTVTQSGTGNGLLAKTGSTTQFAAGVLGIESATSGQVSGVSGQAASSTTNAAGVSGGNIATTGQVYGVAGYTNSTGPFAAAVNGFEGATTGQVFGVGGTTTSATNFAAGVSGSANATTGQVYGVVGVSNSTTNGAAAVNGFEPATTGQVFGVSGSTNSTTNGAAGMSGFEGAKTGVVFGVNGGTNSTSNGAAAVNGFEGATTGNVAGVSGTTPSRSGNGVMGNASATSGNTNGVLGSSSSPTGNGVLGINSATTGFAVGVTGLTNSPSGAGLNGFSNTTSGGIGVIGAAPTSGTAVQGINQVCASSVCTPAKGIAGLFQTGTGGTILLGTSGTSFTTQFSVDSSGNGFYAGNLNVKGKLTKGSGSFRIDHPLDPANKYLSHSFVESPDMMNVYNGNITTDKHGLATIVLPDYFEALNRDFRYQLTVIGQFAQAIVKQEIQNNRFTIRTSRPQVKVSWQVTGIRHDAYADAYRIPVEEEKPTQEQGHYLHPELFGGSGERAIRAGLATPSTTDSPTRPSLVNPLSQAGEPPN